MEPLLAQWYGKEQGEAEMLRFTPSPTTLADALDSISGKLISPWTLKAAQLKETWTKVVGKDNARHCTPASLNEGTLYIEISHPAYRIALDTPAVKKSLLLKIQNEIGADYCTAIKFVIAGRTLR